MNRITCALFAIALCGFLSADSGELDRLDKKTVKNMTDLQMRDRALILEERLADIRELDIEELSRTERKSLKKELRYIDREMTALGNGGIYLSTTAVIIIVLVLILII